MTTNYPNVYVGNRYVPKIYGEWDNSLSYEGLSIVTYQGTSYTSKKRVPIGIDIENSEYWVVTGNYNAQVETYREEVQRVSNQLDEKADKESVNVGFDNVNKQFGNMHLNAFYPPEGIEPLQADGVTDETVKLQNMLDYVEQNGGGTVFIPYGIVIHTINFIPNNVTLLGGGMNRTTIKLKDGYIGADIRKQTGLYPKYNIDYFEIRELTYDGNAENNVDLINSDDYDRYYSHGITNGWTNINDDPYNNTSDILITAKDFFIDHVHIKNTIRNSLLFGGRNNNIGTVGKVLLENAYFDHFIYESNTNSRITYEDVTTKGTFRGAGIVASNGSFNNVKHIQPIQNPNVNFNHHFYLNVRNYNIFGSKTSPHFKRVELDLLFNGLHGIITEGTSNCSYQIESIKVNQMDNATTNIYNVAFTFILGQNGKNIKIKNVEFNNIMCMTLLSIISGASNYTIEDVVYNYNPQSMKEKTDSILSLRNSATDEIRNITIRNVDAGKKAPRLLYMYSYNADTDYTTHLYGITLDNIFAISMDDQVDAFDILTYRQNFTGEKNVIKNTKWGGFISTGTDHADMMRNDLDFSILNSYNNNTPSEAQIRVPVPAGTQELSLDYGYIMTEPRTILVSNIYNGSNIPTIRFSGGQMHVTFNAPTEQYEELKVLTRF